MRGFAASKAARQAVPDGDLTPSEFMKHRASIRHSTRPALWSISNHKNDSLVSRRGTVARGMVTSTVNSKDKALLSENPPQKFVGSYDLGGGRVSPMPGASHS